MSVGPYISGAAHAGLIGWLLLGWGLGAKPLEFNVTEVSMISGDAFEEALRAGQPDAPAEAPAPPTLAAAPDPVPVPPVRPDPPAPRPAPPAPAEAPAPDPQPAPPEPAPQPPAQPASDITDAPEAPLASEPNLEIGTSERPTPRPVERLAPTPAPAPAPEAQVADTLRETEAPQPDPAAPPQVTPQDAAAPEEAATEVVTEAETPSGAPEISLRPKARPARPAPQVAEADPQAEAPTAQAPAPEQAPTPDAPAAPETPPAPAQDDAIAAALAAAAAAGIPAPAAGNPAGTSLTAAETGSFLGQIGQCWNIEAVSTDAQLVTVTLVFRLSPEGMVEPGSIRRMGYTGGTEAAAETAYRVAEQALMECQSRGRSGYDLPPEKYELWREPSIRFNPETMRLR